MTAAQFGARSGWPWTGPTFRPWLIMASTDGTDDRSAPPPSEPPATGPGTTPAPGGSPDLHADDAGERTVDADAPPAVAPDPAPERPGPDPVANVSPPPPGPYPPGNATAGYPAGPNPPYPAWPPPEENPPWPPPNAYPASGYWGPPPPGGPVRGGHPTGRLGRERPGRTRKIVAIVGAVVVVLGLAGVGSYLVDRSQRAVTMLDIDVPGDDPFVPTLVQSGSLVPTVLLDAAAGRMAPGGLDGLYLDTIGTAGCNRAPLEAALQGDPELAGAWGTPLGAAAPAVPALVPSLTPVRLRADTRLTAHGYSGGRAEPYAATLQAGTAVLVDDRGMPRVRCADGAPLTGAQPLADPYYGGAWDGFDPATMVEIRPAAASVVEFGLVDAAGEQPFRRPVGTIGAEDVAALPDTGRLTGPYAFTGRPVRCEGFRCAPTDLDDSFLPRFSGCPAACMVSDRRLGDGIALTRDGAVWRASGDVPPDRATRCVRTQNPVPVAFAVTYTPTASGVVNGAWTATAVKADIELRASPFDGCVAGVLAWTFDGRPG